MTREELFKDLWNTASMSCDTPYKQWVRQGFNWMYGWYESEVKSLKDQLFQAKDALSYYANLEKCKGLECCGGCGDSIIAEDTLDSIGKNKWKCPCGEVAMFADTEGCRTPLCHACAVEIQKALEEK